MTAPKVPTWEEAVERLAQTHYEHLFSPNEWKHVTVPSTREAYLSVARNTLGLIGLTPEHFETLAAVEWVDAQGRGLRCHRASNIDKAPWTVWDREHRPHIGRTLPEAVSAARAREQQTKEEDDGLSE